MKSLRQRFPAYSRTLRLYPRAYYRQYYTQTLQTLADAQDDPDLGRATKIKLHLGAWLDLAKSIPQQRLLAVTRKASGQSSKYFQNRIIACLLLVTPFAVTMLAQLILGLYEPADLSSHSFLSLWFSNKGVLVWTFLLPLAATLNALYTLTIWYAARQKWPKSKRPASDRWGTKLSLAGLLLVSLAGIAFFGLIGTAHYTTIRQTHRDRDLSMAYQDAHPTLACTLLPLASARLISGTKTLYLNNVMWPSTVPYSGIQTDAHGIRKTTCDYQNVDLSKFGVTASVHEAFSPAALHTMQSDFSNQQDVSEGANLQPFSLMGYEGFYGQEPYGFDLSLWVKDYWFQVSTTSLDAATTTMQTMISNLDKELIAQKAAQPAISPRHIVPLPVGQLTLSDNDQTLLEYAIMGKNVRVPAGTELNAHVSSLADDQAAGTFTYSTGLHGTFVAQKKRGSWVVINYKELGKGKS